MIMVDNRPFTDEYCATRLNWASQREWNTDDADLTDHTDQRLLDSDP